MNSPVTLTLPRDFVGQMLDGLSVHIEQWDETAEYMQHGQVSAEPGIIRECSSAEEATAIADDYRRIMQLIERQMS